MNSTDMFGSLFRTSCSPSHSLNPGWDTSCLSPTNFFREVFFEAAMQGNLLSKRSQDLSVSITIHTTHTARGQYAEKCKWLNACDISLSNASRPYQVLKQCRVIRFQRQDLYDLSISITMHSTPVGLQRFRPEQSTHQFLRCSASQQVLKSLKEFPRWHVQETTPANGRSRSTLCSVPVLCIPSQQV